MQRDAEVTVEQAAVSCAQLWLVNRSSVVRWRWTTRSATRVPRDTTARQSYQDPCVVHLRAW